MDGILYCYQCGKEDLYYYWAHPNDNLVYCDNCVPRGCSCNISEFEGSEKLLAGHCLFYDINYELTDITQASFVEYLDLKKRRYPCVDYMGFKV